MYRGAAPGIMPRWRFLEPTDHRSDSATAMAIWRSGGGARCLRAVRPQQALERVHVSMVDREVVWESQTTNSSTRRSSSSGRLGSDVLEASTGCDDLWRLAAMGGM